MIPEILKQPLKFGDANQIRALKDMQRRNDWDELPDCEECHGTGEITHQCEACEGEGKDAKAMDEHFKRYPL